MILNLLVILSAMNAFAAEEYRLRCAADITRVNPEKMELVRDTPALTPEGRKEFWFPLTEKDKNLHAEGLVPFDESFAIHVVMELSPKLVSTSATFRLVTLKAGKVARILSEEQEFSRSNFGLTAYLKNLDLLNLYLAEGLSATEKVDVARILQYIKDGKLPEGSPTEAYVDCQAIKVTAP